MQQKWIVNVQNIEAVKRLEKLGVLLFVPRLPTTPIHVTIKTSQTRDEILRIEGIISARKPTDATLNGTNDTQTNILP